MLIQSLDVAEPKVARAPKLTSDSLSLEFATRPHATRVHSLEEPPRPSMTVATLLPMAKRHSSGLPFSRLSGGVGGGLQPTESNGDTADSNSRHSGVPAAFGMHTCMSSNDEAKHTLFADLSASPMPLPLQHTYDTVAATLRSGAIASLSLGAPTSRALGVLSPAFQQAATGSPRMSTKGAAPTPAHVTAALLVDINGQPLADTPRAATSALLSLAAHHTPCQEVMVPDDILGEANVEHGANSAQLA